ncbi:hypothetical protein GOD62_30530 [Sinorhizobium medicae]|nr:hypothetical protein [Sinorhizobium medicae]MDX0796901.1 hypothetical protein [Sinorhizobium medicae]
MKRSWLSLAMLSLSILCAQPLKADFLNLDDKFGELGMMLDNLGHVLQDATATIAANSTDSDRLATRIFAAPEEYPPTEYAAYGIIAFRSLPSPADKVRYHQICLAYYNTLPASPPQFPEKQQMVTVWPVTSAKASKKLNEPQPADKACETALSDYNLPLGHKAIRAAKIQGKDVDGIGPYLLAWSPSEEYGTDKAVILVADFSNVDTYELAQRIMVAWVNDIESDPKIWEEEFTIERVRSKIKMLVDRYGAEIESFFRANS